MTLSNIFLKCSYSAYARAIGSTSFWSGPSFSSFYFTFSETTISTSMSYFYCLPGAFLPWVDADGLLLPKTGFFASDPPPISKTRSLSSFSTGFFFFSFYSSSITSGMPTNSNFTPPFASTWPSALFAPVEAIFLFLRNSYLAFSRSSFFSARILSCFALSYSFSSWTFFFFSIRLFSWASVF